MPAPVVHVVLPGRPKVRYSDLAGTTIPRQTLEIYRVPPYLRRTLAGLGMALIQARPELTYRTDRTAGRGKKAKPAPDGIEIRFPGRTTSEAVVERLRGAGYKFSSAQKMWYAYDTPDNRAFAETFATDEVEVDDGPTKTVHFWVVAKSVDELYKQGKSTWYNIEGKILKGRGYLGKYGAGALESAVKGGRAKIHLFRDVPADEAVEPGTEPVNNKINTVNKVNSAPVSAPRPAAGPAGWTDAQWAEFHDRQAEKLQALADGMSKEIEGKFNSATSQQNWTRRRASIAASMASDGARLEKVQRALYGLAHGHRNADALGFRNSAAKWLNSKADVEFALYNVKRNLANPYGTRSEDRSKQADFRSWLEGEGVRMKRWQVDTRDLVAAFEVLQQIEAIVRGLSENTAATPAATAQAAQEAEKRAKINALRGQKIPGFFPTPPALIERIIELAGFDKSVSRMLEPSAGKGDLAAAMREAAPNAYLAVAEVNYQLRAILKEDGFDVVASDFTTELTGAVSNPDSNGYDRILMNPPFENGQDIEHVRRAFSMLRPGGRLVAIVGSGALYNSQRRNDEFRAFLSDEAMDLNPPLYMRGPDIPLFAGRHNADRTYQDRLPAYCEVWDVEANSFKDSFNPTGVNVRIIVLEAADVAPAPVPAPAPATSDKDRDRARALALALKLKLKLLELQEEPALAGTTYRPRHHAVQLRAGLLRADLKRL